jgi:hypothetical protein
MKDLQYQAEKLNNDMTAHSNHIESVYSEIVNITASEATRADKINLIREVIQNHDTTIFITAKGLLDAPIEAQEFNDSEPEKVDMDNPNCDACYYKGKVCDNSCRYEVDEADSTGV